MVEIGIKLHFDDPLNYDIVRKEEDKNEVLGKTDVPQRSSLQDISSNVYSDDVVYAPDNIIFDMQHGACLGYMLSLKNYSSMSKSTVRIFKSLLLRSDSKVQSIRFIKYLILKRTSLEILTKVFLKIHGVYKDATKERQKKAQEGTNIEALDIIKTSSASLGGPANQVLRSMSLAVSNSGRNILPSQVGSSKLSNRLTEQCEDTTRIMSGEVIIFQHEIVQLFIDIMDLESLPFTYMKAVIVEYIR